MEKEPQISLIIVSHKSQDSIGQCIESVFKRARNIEKEIIVVGNGNETINLSENIKVINLPENKGFGTACNAGARFAKGKYLCFLNPDTELMSDNLEKIISEFEKDEKRGIIGPKLIGENNKIQEWSAGKEINLWDIVGNNLGIKRSHKIWESREKKECAWVSGACLFIQRELFEKLKGFDKKFFLYFEDIDLCRRARKLGYKILYYPEFSVRHFGGKSSQNKKEQKKLYYKSQDYYFEKHFGKITSNLLKLLRGIFLIG
jgi:GT2 family glycosyltransferase